MKLLIALIVSVFTHSVIFYPYKSKIEKRDYKKVSVRIIEILKNTEKARSTKNKKQESKDMAFFEKKSLDYLNIVRSYIINNKQNYFLIKKMDLKGNVTVKFNILYPNIIQNFSFVQKNETRILNESAKKSVLLIKDLPHMPKELNRDKLTLEVTISYQ